MERNREMIRLIDYYKNEYGSVVLLNKATIGGMKRYEEEGLTCVWNNDREAAVFYFKETPEEILAMPDIEEGSKAIDWEQRRYEIARDIAAAIHTKPNVSGTLLNYNQIVAAADRLIRELKKGTEQ